MANLQVYTQCYVTVNGALLVEEASVTVKRITSSQMVKTVAKGFAGISAGAAMIEIDVSNAVPSAGFEMNPGQYMLTYQVVELGIIGPAGLQLKTKGFFVSDNFQHAVDQEAKIDFTFQGAPADWE